jgi:acetolactate synthase-1/2/3 large subunit
MNADRKQAFQTRGNRLARAHQQADQKMRDSAAVAFDASPISTARLAAEIWAQVKDEDWSLVSQGGNGWARRLWNFDKSYQWIGGAGGYGIGYALPAAVGAALANKKYGRLTVNIQNDGDMLYAPSALWTAAHHRIPMLTVMHNNRAYHQEFMQVQIMADRMSRGIDRATIGTNLIDPNIDHAKLAQAYGLYGEGPISDPKELGPAIKRALAVVKSGQPALVDVLTQPR